LKYFFIVLGVFVIFLSGCSKPFYQPSYSNNSYNTTIPTQNQTITVNRTPQYNQEIRTEPSRRAKVYTARIDVSGDIAYIDRKYFKRTLSEILDKRGIVEDYNSPNKIDIRVITTVEDTKTSGGDSYQNCSAYKLDRKAQGAVIYTIRGKKYYTNSINYKFLVKSASCVSYDDAELKARKRLFRRLGEITADRIARVKGILRESNIGCSLR